MAGTMRGLWLENKQLSLRKNLLIPDVVAGEALIRVRLAGICSTDLEMLNGYYPFRGVPGHEFVGEVVAAPEQEAWLGKRVNGEISIDCGECASCLAGMPGHCENRKTLGIFDYDGVFAEYVRLPIRNLHAVPATVSDEQAVFTELLAAALQVQQQVRVRPQDQIVVVGAGRLGILMAQCLKLTGCDLKVIVRRPEPAALLATLGIESASAQEYRERSADIIIEATGNAEGLALAKRLVKPRGTIVLKSTYTGDVSLDLSRFVVDEITLVGSRCGPFEPALRLLKLGMVSVEPLITGRYALEDFESGYQEALRPGSLKVLFEF